MMDEVTLTTLPIEILPNILIYLDVKSIHNLNKTCDHFRQLLKSESFWSGLESNNMDYDFLPPKNWRQAALNNNFGGNLPIDTSEFNFDSWKLIKSKNGYFGYKPYDFHKCWNRDSRMHKHKPCDYFINRVGFRHNKVYVTSFDPTPEIPLCFTFEPCREYQEFPSLITLRVNFKELGIPLWVMDYVRPKIQIIVKVNHIQNSESVASIRCELSRERREDRSDEEVETTSFMSYEYVQYRILCKPHPRRKTATIEWKKTDKMKWEELILEMDDYPSGMRYAEIDIFGFKCWGKCTSQCHPANESRKMKGPKIGLTKIKVIMPEETILKPYLSSDEETKEEKKISKMEMKGKLTVKNLLIDLWPNVFKYLNDKELLNFSNTCTRFRKIIEKYNPMFWSRHGNTENELFPPLKWRMAAKKNDFGGNLSIDTSKFKFDYRKIALLKSTNGYSGFQPYTFPTHWSYYPDSVKYLVCKRFNLEIGPPRVSVIYGRRRMEDVPVGFHLEYINSQVQFPLDFEKVGIQPWVMDYVRPKIRLTLQVSHKFNFNSEIGLYLELTSRNSDNMQLGNIYDMAKTSNRCKLVQKSWKRKDEDGWEDLVLEMDDYPSGMRYATVKFLRCNENHSFPQKGPYVKTMRVQFIMPDNPELKSYLPHREREEEGSFERKLELFLQSKRGKGKMYDDDEEEVCPAKKIRRY